MHGTFGSRSFRDTGDFGTGRVGKKTNSGARSRPQHACVVVVEVASTQIVPIYVLQMFLLVIVRHVFLVEGYETLPKTSICVIMARKYLAFR